MASGDPVVQVLRVMPPATSAATMDVRAGGSTPAENIIVWDFDDASSEYMDFLCQLKGYGGGGLTFTIYWSATTATAEQVRWELGIRCIADDAEDIDAAHTYQTNGVTATTADTSGELDYATITFTDGADMDSWADGELAVLRLYRDHDHADDDLVGDGELWALVGKES